MNWLLEGKDKYYLLQLLMNMAELTDDEKKIVEVMKSFGAKSEDKLKDVDSIAKASLMPKGKVANVILNLVNKKIIKRIAREKAAGYYLIESMLQ